MTKAVHAVVGSIVVGDMLICCALLHSVYDLKVTQMNVQCSLIQELILYKFEVGHNATEETKNISCGKIEVAVDHSTITRWFKKFCWDHKKLNNQARSGRSKTVDSEDMLQTIEANQRSP